MAASSADRGHRASGPPPIGLRESRSRAARSGAKAEVRRGRLARGVDAIRHDDVVLPAPREPAGHGEPRLVACYCGPTTRGIDGDADGLRVGDAARDVETGELEGAGRDVLRAGRDPEEPYAQPLMDSGLSREVGVAFGDADIEERDVRRRGR